jgi:hypothetical protein
LHFFIDHGLHSAADFIFILNGETDVAESMIFSRTDTDSTPNRDTRHILVKKRSGPPFTLGTLAEILEEVNRSEGWSDSNGPTMATNQVPLKDLYKSFLFLNSYIRAPIVPPESTALWSDIFLNKLNDKAKALFPFLSVLLP